MHKKEVKDWNKIICKGETFWKESVPVIINVILILVYEKQNHYLKYLIFL